MKKFLSLVLAAMMLLSCTAALAANATFTVNTPTSQYDSDSTTATETSDSAVNTEVWLQVDAQGQIDVTVPLVLVFQTNIDGGETTTSNSYKITNNSTADIAVTKIGAVTVTESEATQPMDLVAYGNAALTTTDTYALKLNVAKKEADTTNHRLAHAAYELDVQSIENSSTSADVKDGGLFQVYKGGDTAATVITASMKTGPLSFTTLRKDGTNGSELDTTKGLKLVTLTYTVGIDAQNAIGDTITVDDEDFREAGI